MDWHLVGGDPAPGDPGAIRGHARLLGDEADRAFAARGALDTIGTNLSGGAWLGIAANSFTREFGSIGPVLSVVAEGYDDVGRQLRDYAGALAGFQDAARGCVGRAEAAQRDIDTADGRRDGLERRIRDLQRQHWVVSADERVKRLALAAASGDPPAATAAQHALDRVRATKRAVESALGDAEVQLRSAESDLEAARVRLRTARSDADDIREDRRRCERRVAEAIRGAVDTGLRNRSNFERGAAWVGRNVDSYVVGEADYIVSLLQIPSRLDRARYLIRIGVARSALGRLAPGSPLSSVVGGRIGGLTTQLHRVQRSGRFLGRVGNVLGIVNVGLSTHEYGVGDARTWGAGVGVAGAAAANRVVPVLGGLAWTVGYDVLGQRVVAPAVNGISEALTGQDLGGNSFDIAYADRDLSDSSVTAEVTRRTANPLLLTYDIGRGTVRSAWSGIKGLF